MERRKDEQERLFTTHEVARLIGVEPSSVIRWCNGGALGGWRTPGGHRRIPASSLKRFMLETGREVPADLEAVDARPGGGSDADSIEDPLPRLLWVDGDAQHLLTVQRLLKRAERNGNLVAILIDDPIAALLELREHKPDVVILDCDMEGFDAFRACASLRRQASTEDVRVILASREVDAEQMARGREVGASAVVHSPIPAAIALNLTLDPPGGA